MLKFNINFFVYSPQIDHGALVAIGIDRDRRPCLLFTLKITIQLYDISECPIYYNSRYTSYTEKRKTKKLQKFGTKLTK